VTQNVGNYDYYIEKRTSRAVSEAAEALAESSDSTNRPASRRPRKLSYKETRELETIEGDILEAEEAATKIEAIFNAPDFYEKHGDQWKQLEQDLKTARHRVAELYARWEELEALKAALA
jgi:ATP-binding cassette subfamily F protein uup